jgi:hypothetical protein
MSRLNLYLANNKKSKISLRLIDFMNSKFQVLMKNTKIRINIKLILDSDTQQLIQMGIKQLPVLTNGDKHIYGYTNITNFINNSISNNINIKQQAISTLKKKQEKNHSLTWDDSHLPSHLKEGLKGCKLIGTNSKDVKIQTNDGDSSDDDAISRDKRINQCNKFENIRNSIYNKRDPTKKYMAPVDKPKKNDNVFMDNVNNSNVNNLNVNNSNVNNSNIKDDVSSLLEGGDDDDAILKNLFENCDSTNI